MKENELQQTWNNHSSTKQNLPDMNPWSLCCFLYTISRYNRTMQNILRQLYILFYTIQLTEEHVF